MKHRIIVAACAALAALAAPAAQAQWPERPVTIIVPFPAGGGTDTFARPLAQQLGMQLGQSVVIDNKGGAGGTVGAGVAAKAKPDGYTFFMGGAHHALAPSLYKSLNYNIQKDFVPVALLAQPPQVIVINKQKLPVKTLGEFIAYAKQHSGEINFGTAGKGSTHHLAGELFALQNGIKLVDVPYQGAGPMLSALIGGQVDLAFDGLGSSANHIRAGSIVPLAVASAQRSPAFPDVPTAKEAGVPNYEVSTWYALWAPAGTPKEAVDRMTAEVVKALNQPKIKEIWLANGSATPNLTGAAFGAYVDSEIGRWAKVVKDSGVTLD
ncbi:Bug family tripartite tricarboxylate transporter substrate binding protein [Bordetella pseudohinzii]|uniref:ABC transporter substrate-binding protein n=2 Tax=Bordetella pseudohinzii TaxID=1331258 RepID=A0A0J6EUL0_9BORD|nr:tripartite tricarboxylate transporter substrate binding protein [Bordetella pseudohinzii]ANY17041.1 ABC transporter substrate-binding protein [Bordetella pseudohinzii]KMM24130.1 ABC transporter substrate-binding protein [Bordetella pseudohinzii]KXA78350.1 ABC transporter substrate-binding protein [Bordetella pseudohinzii]KXA78377.1 ABC transporter substrate-binding protein [Bordetella pseudohinzii]CUJ12495.1 Argininosuccinate lyase [Bordetella pseudohinzii]